MKKVNYYQLVIALVLFNLGANAQTEMVKPHENKQGEFNIETNAGKAFQGAFTSAITQLTIKQFFPKLEDNFWMKMLIGTATSYLYEVSLNKNTTTEKQLFVVSGAVSVSVTFEIFKGKR